MSAFIVLTSSDKYGTVDPEVIGPFENATEAEEFLLLDPLWNGVCREPVDGGYAGSAIACNETATPPEEKRREWQEWKDEDEEDLG